MSDGTRIVLGGCSCGRSEHGWRRRGRPLVVLAAEAGADAVLLIGPSTAASVSAAVEAGKRLGVPISLDVPPEHISQSWVRDMERCGVDGFTVTTNIDIGVASRHPLDAARLIRGWTRLPVAVSGGFGETDHSVMTSSDWDILIIGRSVTEALDPKAAAQRVTGAVHDAKAQRDEDQRT